jgi:FixJ family two-component response regulator
MVAVVDDDESIRAALIPALESIGLQAVGFDSADAFLGFDRLADVGCLVTDLKMPGVSGLELTAKLRGEGYAIPTVIMTAHGASEARSQAMAAGAIAYLDKPFDVNSLLETVRSLIERSGGS